MTGKTTTEDPKRLVLWFVERAGDHIPNDQYQKLLPEFAELVTGESYDNGEQVIRWLYEVPEEMRV